MKLRFNTKLMALALVAVMAAPVVKADDDKHEVLAAKHAAAFAASVDSLLASDDVKSAKLKEIQATYKNKQDRLAKAEKSKADNNDINDDTKVKAGADGTLTKDEAGKAAKDLINELKVEAFEATGDAAVALLAWARAEGKDHYSKAYNKGRKKDADADRNAIEKIKYFLWTGRGTAGKAASVAGVSATLVVAYAAAKCYSETGSLSKTLEYLKQMGNDLVNTVTGKKTDEAGRAVNVANGLVLAGAVAAPVLTAGAVLLMNRKSDDKKEDKKGDK